MRMSELKKREVINVCDCRRLGFVGDLDIDPCSGKILAIIVPGPGCVCGFLGREKDFVIPFDDICQIGDDIILVRLEEKKEKPPKPPKPGPPAGTALPTVPVSAAMRTGMRLRRPKEMGKRAVRERKILVRE